ncbi:uncharacterized protein LOC144141837 [Haemaphysalis longicornis]
MAHAVFFNAIRECCASIISIAQRLGITVQIKLTSREAVDRGERKVIVIITIWTIAALVGILLGALLVRILGPDETGERQTPRATTKTSPSVELPSRSSASPSVELPSPSSTSVLPSPTPIEPEPAVNRNVCYAQHCLKSSRQLQEWLSPLADPCREWTEHVCGLFEGPSPSVMDDLESRISALVEQAALELAKASFSSIAPSQSPSDARLKAARLLLACRSAADGVLVANESHVLRDFMAQHKLIFTDSEPPVNGDVALELHVKFAFTYGLSGLISLGPGVGHRTLELDVDKTINARIVAFTGSLTPELEDYMSILSQRLGKNQASADMLRILHFDVKRAMNSAVASAKRKPSGGDFRNGVVEIRPADLVFANVSRGSFADALQKVTPYPRDAHVEATVLALHLLDVVWSELTPAEIVTWTACGVLHEFIDFADPDVRQLLILREEDLRQKCDRRVRHVMPLAFAAVGLLNAPTRRIQVRVSE